jgi:hypothetical protein
MLKDMIEPVTPQMTIIRRMRVACCITKVTYTLRICNIWFCFCAWPKSAGPMPCQRWAVRRVSQSLTVEDRSRTNDHSDDNLYFIYFLWLCSPSRAMASLFTRFLDHTQRRATVGRTPLDESQRPLPDNTQQTNIHTLGGIRTHDHSRWAAVGLQLRPRGHWDWWW